VVERWYEIHVRGEIPAEALAEFEGLTTLLEPAETVISGPVADQAALQGVLARVQALGLELVEVRRLPGTGAPPSAAPPTQPPR
jgi:hypothetical protein